MDDTTRRHRLLLIKVAHTLVWVLIAGAILALYPAIALDCQECFAGLHLLIGAEIIALALSGWRCPLTRIAARYTDDRGPNFDIFLPAALARWNMVVFTTILVLAWGWAAWTWLV